MMNPGATSQAYVWSLEHLRGLFLRVTGIGAPIIDLEQFAGGEPGVWLRHDVEIDLDAAIAVAQVEAEAGVRASFFVCPESPFITADEITLRAWTSQILAYGHTVSLHMLLGTEVHDLDSRVRRTAEHIGISPPADLTFHAPGLDSQVLALVPGGARVYGHMAANSCQYLSDSTGRWRWGNPWQTEFDKQPTQLLTHPFWWAGDRARVAELCSASEDHAAFLPQFRSEVLGI